MVTASILKDVEFNEIKPVINVLFETNFTKEIRIAMKAGTKMNRHKTPFPIVVEVVEGNIYFGVENSILDLEKGNLIALEGGVPHDLNAKQDSVIRLTLTKYDQTDRVKNVVDK